MSLHDSARELGLRSCWEAFFHDSDYEASVTLFRHDHFAGVAGGLAVEVGATAPLLGTGTTVAG